MFSHERKEEIDKKIRESEKLIAKLDALIDAKLLLSRKGMREAGDAIDELYWKIYDKNSKLSDEIGKLLEEQDR